MNILTAFLPFLAFAVIDRLLGALPGLVAGAGMSAALIARDWLGAGRRPKILEAGSALLFGGLALFVALIHADLPIMGVRLLVDAGLLLIVLASIALHRPFTLQYAREQVQPEIWTSPAFYRVNLVITAAWALAFAIIVLADAALLYLPQMPHQLGIVAIVGALVGAAKFTRWYPSRSAA